jgi:TolB-like protein
MSLFAELKRRNVIRMAGLYLVGAWLLTQVASTVLPTFDVPSWVLRALIIVLALGFVPMLIFSWVFELTPQGLKRDADVKPDESIAPQTARRMDRMIIAVLICALVYFGVDKFVFAPRRDVALVAQTTEHIAANAVAEKSKVNLRSIAVLPFVNMSTDAENEFFSDGLSEEILNSLARIDGMQVVGRTSSFQFKGKNDDLRTIGDKLGVASVLEGSVRREGDRARITAQLIRTSDGIHLWSQTYDRTLKDTLAVQLDIAEQVAGALNVVLDDKQRERMRDAGVKNVDAFIAYQKGWKLYIDGHRKPELNLIDTLRLANVEFDKAIALEPDFSFAYFAEADFYEHILLADDRSQAERLDAQRSALRTLELAATHSPDAQQRDLALAERQLLSDDWHGLSDRIDTALRQPGCSAPNWMPVFASAFGYGDLIEDLGARVNACDPLNGINFSTRAWVARATGHAERALAVQAVAAKASSGIAIASANVHQVIAMVMLGHIDEAKKLLASMDASGEPYYMAQAIVGRATGEDAKNVHTRLQGVERKDSKMKMWAIADATEAALSDNRVEANRQAAALDARPAGGVLLAVLVTECQCGAPFDIDATPNFKARLAESGLHWPPPETIKYPLRAQKSSP